MACAYSYNVLVISNQTGIEPSVFPQIGMPFDKSSLDIHSGGKRGKRLQEYTYCEQFFVTGNGFSSEHHQTMDV